jgi:uncharacterized membrane-anchored protein YhcB (DUF1043 family)
MTWIIVASSLLAGVVIGLLIGGKLSANPSRVKELEAQLRDAKETERRYRDNVSDHFSMTADLVQHLASGAQDLCPEDVAGKLLPTKKDAAFSDEASEGEIGALVPPKDYAAKATPNQKGALSEDFGLEKPAPAED